MLTIWRLRRSAGECGRSLFLLGLVWLGLGALSPGQHPGSVAGGIDAMLGATACRADEPTEQTDQPDAAATEIPTVVAPAESAESAATEDAPPTRSPLPRSFELLRPIYFFGGQASGIVPDFFRPIAIEQLEDRITVGRQRIGARGQFCSVRGTVGVAVGIQRVEAPAQFLGVRNAIAIGIAALSQFS